MFQMYILCRASIARLSCCHARYVCHSAVLAKGHSKWQNIKDTKQKMDKIRSQRITYLLNKMREATKSGGFDIKTNSKLIDLQNEFRAQSLPLDTFNRYLVKLKVSSQCKFSH